MKMKYDEFVKQYCQDILKSKTIHIDTEDLLDGLPYDSIQYDDDDLPYKSIDVDGYHIPLEHILSSKDEEAFKVLFPQPECVEAYKLYNENLVVISGPEVIERIRSEIANRLKEAQRLSMMQLDRWEEF